MIRSVWNYGTEDNDLRVCENIHGDAASTPRSPKPFVNKGEVLVRGCGAAAKVQFVQHSRGCASTDRSRKAMPARGTREISCA